MKTPILLAAALAIPVFASPVMADDTDSGSFHALSELSPDNLTLSVMTDNELARVDGARYRHRRGGDRCYRCSNSAYVSQTNLSIGSFGVSQSNSALVVQSNN